MKISLELNRSDAGFLVAQLVRHVGEIDDELVRTDRRDLQRELAADAARVRRILAALEQRIDAFDCEERFFDEIDRENSGTDARLVS